MVVLTEQPGVYQLSDKSVCDSRQFLPRYRVRTRRGDRHHPIVDGKGRRGTRTMFFT